MASCSELICFVADNGILGRVSHHFDKTPNHLPRTNASGAQYGGIPSSEEEGGPSSSNEPEVETTRREEDSVVNSSSDIPFSPYASTSILFHGELLSLVLLFAGAALAASVVTPSATIRFYSFLIFEGTVGMYCEFYFHLLDVFFFSLFFFRLLFPIRDYMLIYILLSYFFRSNFRNTAFGNGTRRVSSNCTFLPRLSKSYYPDSPPDYHLFQ